MKPISSPLRILDFAIMRMDYEFVPPEESAEPQHYFGQYDLDIDFSIFKNSALQIVITAQINCSEKPLPGYKISTDVAVLFKLDDTETMTEDEKQSVEGYSTVYMALNSLRTLVSGFTANAPFGRYILPSIDLNDLIKKKRQSTKKEPRAETQKRKKVKKI